MVHEYRRIIRHLWHSAPYWRYSVIAAGLFSLVAFIHTVSESPAKPGRLPPPDPGSTARWTEYEQAHTAAMKVMSSGARCEALVTALGKLTTDDLSKGRSPVFASKQRIAALADGERCRNDLVKSDQRFTALQTAVAAAEARPEPDTIKAAADAVAALDDFDRARARFASEAALLTQGQVLAEKLTISDTHIRELLQAAEVFAADRSGAVHVRLSEALKQLTDFDRSRLSKEQQAALESANQALATLSESRTRLAKLFPLLSALPANQSGQIKQQLVEATVAITPFDEQVATADQQAALRKAKAAVQPFAWELLQERLQVLASDGVPANVQTVVALYTLLKDLPGSGLNDQQRTLLDKGREAADMLSASDDRLNALLTASTWLQPNEMPQRRILPPLHAITPFDRARFHKQHTLAWDTLSRAEAILRGPELGLTAENKGRVPIFVFSSGAGDWHPKVATALRDALKNARFPMAANRHEAALLADVTVLDSGAPQIDYSGPIVAKVSTLRLKLTMMWVADDSVFWSDEVEGTARGAQESTLQDRALLHALSTLTGRLQHKLDSK